MMELKNTARYLIFVDFDGVLTSNRVHFSHPKGSYLLWATFDPVVMEFFNKIHNTYDGVEFVWTTTWRNHLQESGHIAHIVTSMWYNAGFRGMLSQPWRVNPDNTLPTHKRAEEIDHYLKTYAPDVDDYVIIDDSDYGFNKILPKKRFVKTSPDDGMLFKHMRNAWALMGDWKKR